MTHFIPQPVIILVAPPPTPVPAAPTGYLRRVNKPWSPLKQSKSPRQPRPPIPTYDPRERAERVTRILQHTKHQRDQMKAQLVRPLQ
jgi:hypothetical protein